MSEPKKYVKIVISADRMRVHIVEQNFRGSHEDPFVWHAPNGFLLGSRCCPTTDSVSFYLRGSDGGISDTDALDVPGTNPSEREEWLLRMVNAVNAFGGEVVYDDAFHGEVKLSPLKAPSQTTCTHEARIRELEGLLREAQAKLAAAADAVAERDALRKFGAAYREGRVEKSRRLSLRPIGNRPFHIMAGSEGKLTAQEYVFDFGKEIDHVVVISVPYKQDGHQGERNEAAQQTRNALQKLYPDKRMVVVNTAPGFELTFAEITAEKKG